MHPTTNYRVLALSLPFLFVFALLPLFLTCGYEDYTEKFRKPPWEKVDGISRGFHDRNSLIPGMNVREEKMELTAKPTRQFAEGKTLGCRYPESDSYVSLCVDTTRRPRNLRVCRRCKLIRSR